MVRLGFIVEGDTEKIILEQSDFFSFLDSHNIAYIPEVIDAKGNGNLLPHNIVPHTKALEDKGATCIFILTDLDDDQCISNTKDRIGPHGNHTIVVSIKTIESWFLADSSAMGSFLNDPEFAYGHPEAISNPYEEIRAIRAAKTGRGFGSKPILAKQMVRNNFSILKAAQHDECKSAKYFLRKVAEVTGTKIAL